MLAKLIKHDFKALSRILVPTQLAVLAASILATIGFAFNTRAGMNAAHSNTAMQILQVVTIMISGLLIFAIFASIILVAIIIFYHFYKSFITDEGYLTFTLPTTSGKLLWSKLITAMLWLLISSVVIFLCFNIFLAFGISDSGVVNGGYIQFISEFFRIVGQNMTWSIALLGFELLLLVVVGTASGVLQVYLALIMGGVVAQKNKLLAGIGFYFAINILVSILATVGQFIVGNKFINFTMSVGGESSFQANANALVSAFQPFILYYIGISGLLAVAFFLCSRWMIKNKLNLS